MLRGISPETQMSSTNLNSSSSDNNISVLHLNVQSLKSAIRIEMLINLILMNESVDFFSLNETWLASPKILPFALKQYKLDSQYSVITDHQSPSDEAYNGKGTAIIFKNKWFPYIQKIEKYHGRLTSLSLHINHRKLIITSVYIPSSSSYRTDLRNTIRRNIFNKLIDSTQTDTENADIIIMGDFNGILQPIDRITNGTNPRNIRKCQVLKNSSHKTMNINL